MPKFRYKAYTQEGVLVEETAEASTMQELVNELKSKNYTVVEVESLTQETKKRAGKGVKKKKVLFGGVSDRDMSLMCRQLGALVRAGVGIVEAIEIIAEQMPNPILGNALESVAKMVSEGSSITNAMSKHRKVFPDFVINLVAVGEETGNLDTSLMRAAEYYEKMAMIKSKIKSASFYPVLVVVIATVIVTGILYFLVPIFAEIYASFGATLPLPTQMLINASNFLKANILQILGGTALIIVAFRYMMRKSYSFRKNVHRFILRTPKFGDLALKSAMAKFGRTMATLFVSGVSLDRALQIASEVAGNLIIKEAVDLVQKEVTEGQPMWQAMERQGIFPRLAVAMVKVGEETGNLDDMLESLARFYEDEVDKTVEGIVTLIEPLLVVTIGCIVGVILIALYMPIFKIGEIIK